VNDLDRILLLVVDVDRPRSIRRRALRRNVLELDRADDVPAVGIDRDERPDWSAVIRQDELIFKLVAHDAVETGVWHLDLLDDNCGT